MLGSGWGQEIRVPVSNLPWGPLSLARPQLFPPEWESWTFPIGLGSRDALGPQADQQGDPGATSPQGGAGPMNSPGWWSASQPSRTPTASLALSLQALETSTLLNPSGDSTQLCSRILISINFGLTEGSLHLNCCHPKVQSQVLLKGTGERFHRRKRRQASGFSALPSAAAPPPPLPSWQT